MLKIVICDDIKTHNRFVEAAVQAALDEYELPGEIALVTDSAAEALQFSQTPGELRLYFLDINMESATEGLELADKIRQRDADAYIVYITAHAEYSIAGYRTKTFDFLLKPLNAEMIRETVRRVFQDMALVSKRGRVFQFKAGSVMHHIPLSDILYMKKEKNVLHVYTENGRISGYGSLKRTAGEFSKSFALCNKSCLASLGKIKELDTGNRAVLLENGLTLSVSRHFKTALAEAMEAYRGE